MNAKSHRIDAHQHFWSYQAQLYPWIDGSLQRLGRDHLPPELGPLLEAQGICGTVAVQARQDLDETRWLLQLAEQHAWILGVVGWVDLRSDELGAELAQVSDSKLRGIRHVLQDETPEFLHDRRFRRGLGQLAAAGLCYDLLVHPRHLANSVLLCEENPELSLVVDHAAKPRIQASEFEPWASDLRRLAAFPQVMCKVSGLVTEAAWSSWRADQFRPYLDLLFEAFGSERLMFGSDWPVCTVAASYAEVCGLVEDYLQQLDDAGRSAVMGGNAQRFYGLELPTG